MSTRELTDTINQHAYTADGMRYGFIVATVAREPRWSGATRYLFAVRVLAEAARHGPVLDVLIRARASKDEAIRSLEHALQDHLNTHAAGAA